ncbi:MAG: hypothetical protein ACREDK_02665 [Thermoplasmata archaeon]
MGYTTLKLCSNGGAFEATPRPRLMVDLEKARRDLTAKGVSVVDARVMLIVSLVPELTLGRDGRVVIKTRDATAAERAFQELAAIVGLDRRP